MNNNSDSISPAAPAAVDAAAVPTAGGDWLPSVEGSLDHCIKCNICTTVCPVSRVTDLFPGPKYVGPQAQRMRDPMIPLANDSVDLCSGCGLCSLACPHGVRIAQINVREKARIASSQRRILRDALLARPDLLGRVATKTTRIFNRAVKSPTLRRLGEKVLGVAAEGAVPTSEGYTFRQWIAREARRSDSARSTGQGTVSPRSGREEGSPREPGEKPEKQPSGLHRVSTRDRQAGKGKAPAKRRVAYFYGCAANYFEPRVARAAVDVLRHNGVEVTFPYQGCCGLPLINNGDFQGARAYAARHVGTLADAASDGSIIITTSTSCSLTLQSEYRELLGLDGDDINVIAENTMDIFEYLTDMHMAGELDTSFKELPGEVVYHAPCQLRSHVIGKPALSILKLIPGLIVDDPDHDCCGIAGTYGLKAEKYDIAYEVGRALFEHIDSVKPQECICDSETCRWQIQQATGVPTLHPIELVARAYGYNGKY